MFHHFYFSMIGIKNLFKQEQIKRLIKVSANFIFDYF